MARETLKALRATIRLKSLAPFTRIKNMSIPSIPSIRSKFPGTEHDYWYKVDLSNHVDADACMYEIAASNNFAPHIHDSQSEVITVLTPGAKIDIVTEEYEKTLGYLESHVIKPGEPHACVNMSAFKVQMLVVWAPKHVAWNASFISKETIEQLSLTT